MSGLLLPLLFLSYCHIFLYPLVSISTGEGKPRGFYIDENSLSSAVNIGFQGIKQANIIFDSSDNQSAIPQVIKPERLGEGWREG